MSCSLALPVLHSPNSYSSHHFTSTATIDYKTNLIFCHSFHLNGHPEISQLEEDSAQNHTFSGMKRHRKREILGGNARRNSHEKQALNIENA